MNVDATIFTAFNRMGLGVVCRNHLGECLVGCFGHIKAVTSPELAQVLAVCQAIYVTRAENFQEVILASDCLSVIQ